MYRPFKLTLHAGLLNGLLSKSWEIISESELDPDPVPELDPDPVPGPELDPDPVPGLELDPVPVPELDPDPGFDDVTFGTETGGLQYLPIFV